jgi:peroxiredoxin
MMTMTLWALGLVAMVAGEGAASVQDEGTLKVGDAAPMFTGKVLNAEVAGIRSQALDKLYEGKKAVILSFFATYCEPCKKELPYLQAMYARYKDDGLAVAVVSIDQKPEDIAKVSELVQGVGATYPVLSDRFNIVAKRYGVKRLPCLYILDGTGKVSMVNTGYSEDISGALLAAVQTRLGVAVDPGAVAHAPGGEGGGSPAAAPAAPPGAPSDAAAGDEGGKKKKGKRRK